MRGKREGARRRMLNKRFEGAVAACTTQDRDMASLQSSINNQCYSDQNGRAIVEAIGCSVPRISIARTEPIARCTFKPPDLT